MLKKIIKWSKITALILVVILFVAYIAVYLLSQHRIQKNYTFTNTTLNIPTDSIALAKGKHVYSIRSCGDCHGENGAGKVFMNDWMLMQLTAPNLTNRGIAANFTTADWVRVLRHGIDKNGKSLLMMPSHEVTNLTNEDLANLIAYCKSLQPITAQPPQMHSIGPIGRILLLMNNVTVLPAEKIDHQAQQTEKMEQKSGAMYGKYLSTGCQGCHRTDLKGGGPLAPGFPPVPDITSGGNLHNWNEQSFISTIRTGQTPEGKKLNNEYMPWKSISHFTDDELKAIYSYLKQL